MGPADTSTGGGGEATGEERRGGRQLREEEGGWQQVMEAAHGSEMVVFSALRAWVVQEGGSTPRGGGRWQCTRSVGLPP